jgi:hypothetical protein
MKPISYGRCHRAACGLNRSGNLKCSDMSRTDHEEKSGLPLWRVRNGLAGRKEALPSKEALTGKAICILDSGAIRFSGRAAATKAEFEWIYPAGASKHANASSVDGLPRNRPMPCREPR